MNVRSITLSARCIWFTSLAMAGCDRDANDGVPAFAVVRPEPSRRIATRVREAQAAPAAPHRCALEGEAHTVAPRAALDTGLTLVTAGNALALGWAVPGAHPTPAGVAIGLDGAPGAVIEPTLPALPRDLQRWTHNATGSTAAIFHVVPFVTTEGRTTLQVDRRLEIPATEGRREIVLQCGSIADLVTTIDPNADMNGNDSDFAACHTMPTGAEPAVVTIMLQSSREGVDYNVSLYVSRTAVARGTAPAATHTLEVANSAGEREEAEGETRVFLRRFTAAFEPQLIAAPGGGYALTFRDGHGLYLAWLDAAFHARGPATRVATLGGTPGVARLATNGREVLMLWADRARDAAPARGSAAAAGSNRYALHVRHFAPGAAPGTDAPARLATTSAEVNAASGEQDEFAPSATALDDGTWLIAWSRGPLRASRNGTPAQNVFLRHYAADLAPLGDAMRIDAAQGASDARVIARQGRFVVAALAGRGAAREIRTYAGRCDLP